ncbi:ATF/CREB activator, partial [Asimina triloba]
YTGSLTVPPCTENVIWSVLVKVRELTKEQVAALKAPLDSSCKNNARPVQPLNDRKVTMYEEDSSR